MFSFQLVFGFRLFFFLVFADCCRLSTDFHFPSIDEQLASVQQFAIEIKETKEMSKQEGGVAGGGVTDISPNKLTAEQNNTSISPDR